MTISNEFLKFAIDQYILWKAQVIMWNRKDIAGTSSTSQEVLVAQGMKRALLSAKVQFDIDSAELTIPQLVAHALSLIEEDDDEYDKTMMEIGSDTALYKYMNAEAKKIADSMEI